MRSSTVCNLKLNIVKVAKYIVLRLSAHVAWKSDTPEKLKIRSLHYLYINELSKENPFRYKFQISCKAYEHPLSTTNQLLCHLK